LQPGWIVLKHTKAGIAFETQKAAKPARFMAVINIKPLWDFLANQASPVLLFQS
jgi:hypothetical protein